MKLTRIRLEQFRQFRKPLEIDGLHEGMNLFTGPNEAGKSTIVAAVRAAFFERHRSSSVDDLRPWGDPGASPSVSLDFTVAGTPYRLSKSFLGKKRCELQVGSQRFDGAQAEDVLAELLGFQYAGKGASAAQHWGIPGLLWIQQGAGHEIRDPVLHATDHLRHALDESLGEVASSGGDEVLALVESRRNELLTPAGGAARGVFAEAVKRQAELEAAVKALDADVAAYRQQVDLLASLRREQAADDAGKPWAAFRVQEQAARGRLEAIERVQAALAADRQRAAQLAVQVGLQRTQVEAFAAEEAAAQGRAAAIEPARRLLDAAEAAVKQWAAQVAQAVQAQGAARDRLRRVRQAQARAALAREQADLADKARSSQALLDRAVAEHATLLALQQQAAALRVDAPLLQTLRQQGARLRELQIQRDAVATRLRFHLAEGAGLHIGDEPVQGSGERLLTAPTRVQLGALGTLEILPGGADLAGLVHAQDALHDEHAALLQRSGLVSLEAAEARHLAHTQRAAEVKTAAATLKALAPKGIDELKDEALALAARAGEVAAALEGLPAAPDDAAGLPSLHEAEAAEDAARHALEQMQASLGPARVAAGNAQAQVDAAQREHAAALALVAAPDRAQRLQAAQQALVDALAEQAALALAVKARADEVAQARPDILLQDIERFARSAQTLERAFDDRKTALLRLEVALEGAGAQGLEERAAEAARDLAQAQRRAAELRRRALALDHLLGLLKARRSALTSKLQAPLHKHLDHYLQLLFPQAALQIDPHLSPGPLTRQGAHGPESGEFEALSFGAREQMGVISRLAYADLLQAAGRPTLIMLDDALVHSDEARLAQMKRILFDAATRHQVLLFTCHPQNWRDLGVAARSVDSLRAG